MSSFDIATLNLPPEAVETIREVAAERGVSDEECVREHLAAHFKELRALREIAREGRQDITEGRYIEVTTENFESVRDEALRRAHARWEETRGTASS